MSKALPSRLCLATRPHGCTEIPECVQKARRPDTRRFPGKGRGGVLRPSQRSVSEPAQAAHGVEVVEGETAALLWQRGQTASCPPSFRAGGLAGYGSHSKSTLRGQHTKLGSFSLKRSTAPSCELLQPQGCMERDAIERLLRLCLCGGITNGFVSSRVF